MSAALGWAVLLGLSLGLGLWSLVSLTPRLSRPRLADRVAPYILDISEGARELTTRRSMDPLPVIGTLFAPAFLWMRGALSLVLGGAETIELRLGQAGLRLSVLAFRTQQLIWALLGCGLGAVAAIATAPLGTLPLAVSFALPIVCGVAAAILRDLLLQRTARARIARMTSELPTVLQLLSLSLSAGEGIHDALRRIATVGSGELAHEFAGVLAESNTGVPLVRSLAGLSRHLQMPALDRTVAQLIGAIERGTPLADVLRAQAHDARDESKRELLEAAGKKEVAMLLPVVFMILPLTVLFAIYPGIYVLQAGF